jgi:hypothetical protein
MSLPLEGRIEMQKLCQIQLDRNKCVCVWCKSLWSWFNVGWCRVCGMKTLSKSVGESSPLFILFFTRLEPHQQQSRERMNTELRCLLVCSLYIFNLPEPYAQVSTFARSRDRKDLKSRVCMRMESLDTEETCFSSVSLPSGSTDDKQETRWGNNNEDSNQETHKRRSWIENLIRDGLQYILLYILKWSYNSQNTANKIGLLGCGRWWSFLKKNFMIIAQLLPQDYRSRDTLDLCFNPIKLLDSEGNCR